MFRQITHQLVAQSPVGHVDEGIRLYLLHEPLQVEEGVDGIHIILLFHQGLDEVSGIGDESGHHHLRGSLCPDALLLHELLVVAYGHELLLVLARLFVGQWIEQVVVGLLLRQFDLSGIDNLAVDVAAQEVKHAAAVLL